MEQPRTSELASAAGISKSYASEVLSSTRQPSRSLAIHIFRKTGWKHELIADLTDEQINLLAEIEPWTPPKERASFAPPQDAAA